MPWTDEKDIVRVSTKKSAPDSVLPATPPPVSFTPALPQTTFTPTAIRERPTFSTWDTAPARIPVGLESSYIPIRKAGERPTREAFVPELRVGRPPGLGEKVFEGLRLATGQPYVKTTPGIEPGSGGEAEIMRVVGSGLSALSGGLTDVPGYLQRRMTGEVTGGAPRTVGGAIGSAPLTLAGFIKGPMALAQSRLGVLEMPAGASKLEKISRLAVHGGKTLGLASIYGGVAPAIMESERLSQVPMEIAKSGATGATMGFLYPWLGVMKNKGASQAVRMALGVAMMDVLRSGGKQGIFTLDDVAKATINGEIDPKQLAEATLGVLQDAYFSAVQPTYREAKVAKITKTRELTPLDQTILNMKPVDIQSAMSALTRRERLLPPPRREIKASKVKLSSKPRPSQNIPGKPEVKVVKPDESRWYVGAEPVATIPGEPWAYLDPLSSKPSDLMKAKAVVIEVVDEKSDTIGWEIRDREGTPVYNPATKSSLFASADEARVVAEKQFGTKGRELKPIQPVSEPVVTPTPAELAGKSKAKTVPEVKSTIVAKPTFRVMVAGKEVGKVGSFEEASKKYSKARDVINEHSWGAGKPGGQVPIVELIDKDGNNVAYVSYNGNVWDAKNEHGLLYNATGLVKNKYGYWGLDPTKYPPMVKTESEAQPGEFVVWLHGAGDDRAAVLPTLKQAQEFRKAMIATGRFDTVEEPTLVKSGKEYKIEPVDVKPSRPTKLVDQLAQKYGEKTGTTPERIGLTDKWKVGDKEVSLAGITSRLFVKKVSDKLFGVSHTGEEVEPHRLIAVPRDKTKPVKTEVVDGVKVIKPELPSSSDKDMKHLEYGLGSLFVGDIHPYMKNAVGDVNLSDQKTVHATRFGIEKVQDIFSGIKGNMLNQMLFRLKGETLPNLNDMVRGKIPVPKHLEKPVADLKAMLKEYRQKIIEYKRENLFSHLTPKQVEYARWVIAGSKGDSPKNVKTSTKIAADGVVKEWNDLAAWGKENYFPEHFSGAYKYVDSETGGIVASGQTARQATVNLEAFLTEHPEARKRTYQPTNDLIELLTLRRTLNPDLVSDIQFWGSVLSRKDYAMLQSQVKNMVADLSGMKPKDVKIDLKGIAKVFPGGKFSPHFMEKKTELKGDFQDPERVMIAYVINIERKLGLEKMRQRSFDYAQKLRESGKPVAAGYLENLATNVAGRYDLTNRVVDSMLGKRLGLKPFFASRISSSAQQFVAGATLGYSLVKAGLNRIGGMMHTGFVPGVRPQDFQSAWKWMRTDEGKKTVDEIGYRLGLDTFFTDTGKLKGVTKKIYEPTGMFNLAEMQNRPEAFAVIYQKARREGMSHDRAVEHAIDIAQLTQGLYNTAARPVIIGMGGPAIGTAYQFKQYMMNEARMINRFKSSPEFWAKYIPGTIMLAGSRGAWITIKSMLFLTIAQRGIEEVLEEWNTKHPKLHRGLPGTLGIDVSAPTTWQLPQTPSDWMGPVYKDIMKTGQFLIKGLRNMHFTDEEIARYIQTVAPVANLIWEGLQLVKTGEVKQGEQVKYRGEPWEGMVNVLGARTVEQSREMDTSRYWRETQRTFNKEGEYLRQRFNEADTDAERWKVLEKMFDKGHPLTGLDQAMINNLMTQEERATRALSPALKIKKMQMEQKGD